MRLLMEVQIPVEKGNSSKADGSMEKAIQAFIASAQPESAYFHLRNGKRAAIFVFEESRPENLMEYNEALFAALDAEIRIEPVLNLEELKSQL